MTILPLKRQCFFASVFMGGVGRWRVVEQNPVRRAFEILELAGLQGPGESGETDEAKKKSRGDQVEECAHAILPARPPRNRKAFDITISEDEDIASAAISGVTSPATASGTATRL